MERARLRSRTATRRITSRDGGHRAPLYGRSMRNMMFGRVKSSAPRRQTGAPVAGEAAGAPFVTYVTVVAFTRVTAKLPLYSGSLAPAMVMMSFVARLWLASVTSIAVVPLEVSRETGRPLSEDAELARSQYGYPVAGEPVRSD